MELLYGTGSIQVDMPRPVHVIAPRLESAAAEPAEKALEKQLSELLKTGRTDLSSVGIAIADKTRLCGYEKLLPVLTGVLLGAGARRESIRFYIAYGTHPRQSDEESRKAYGSIFDQFPFVHHDCDDDAALERIGITSRGTPVCLRKEFLESSCRITFGAVSHHYFAGFGGGRKLIFPGLAGRAGIYRNHSLFVGDSGPSPGCQPGMLAGNPVAEDLEEAAGMVPVDVAIHGILAADGTVSKAVVGRSRRDFLEACRLHANETEMAVEKDFDIVIASCGGFPKDINLIQAHKSLHNAAMFTSEGGTIVLLAECRDGVGSSTFLPWFGVGQSGPGINQTTGRGGRCRPLTTCFSADDYACACKALRESYEGNGGTALAMMDKARRFRIVLVTSLSRDICARIGVKHSGPPTGAMLSVAGLGVRTTRIGTPGVAVLPWAALTVRRRTRCDTSL